MELYAYHGARSTAIQTHWKWESPGFPGGPAVKKPPAVQETQVPPLIPEDPTCPGATESGCRSRAEKNRPLRAPGAEPRAPRLQERPRINRDPAQRNRHKQARFLKTETSSQILLPALTNSFSVRRGRSLWKYQWKFFQEVFSSRSFLGVQHHQLQSITDFCKTSQLATQYWLSKNLVILSKWF